MIYLDNAATTLTRPDCVAEAVLLAMSTHGNASRGSSDPAMQSLRTCFEARCLLARLFHAPDPSRVIFTQNATAALNMAIYGSFRGGGHIITTVCEHNSVLRPLYRLGRECGLKLTILPADPLGRVPPQAFRDAIREDTCGIVCTHASNVTGNVLDIASIGRIASDHGLTFIVDASQSAGLCPIDMEQMHISILCFTGHKALLGPQGTGGLCLDERTELPPVFTGGSGVSSFLKEQPSGYPDRLEAGTLNSHGIAGLKASVSFLLGEGTDAVRRRECLLAESFAGGLSRIPGIRIYGDIAAPLRVPIVSLNLGDVSSSLISDALSQRFGIATRPGAHCAPLMHGHFGTVSQGMVRFSFSFANTQEDVTAALHALEELSGQLLHQPDH